MSSDAVSAAPAAEVAVNVGEGSSAVVAEPSTAVAVAATSVVLQEAPADSAAQSSAFYAEARKAYTTTDVALSRAVHDEKLKKPSDVAALEAAKETHGGAGSDSIKSIVFGGLDGVITTFSIVAAVAGASLPVETSLLMGFSNLIADGISMGLGDFLSSKAELEFVKSEQAREEWELKNYPEGEVAEMIALYEAKGVAHEDAETILRTMVKYPTIFLPHMMQEELGLPSADADASPAKDGLVTFLSFLAFGSVPMWAYLITWGAKYRDPNGVFAIACAVTAATMFALGAVQALITRQNILRSGTLMLVNGSLAAASAYLVGWGLEEAIGNGTA